MPSIHGSFEFFYPIKYEQVIHVVHAAMGRPAYGVRSNASSQKFVDDCPGGQLHRPSNRCLNFLTVVHSKEVQYGGVQILNWLRIFEIQLRSAIDKFWSGGSSPDDSSLSNPSTGKCNAKPVGPMIPSTGGMIVGVRPNSPPQMTTVS